MPESHNTVKQCNRQHAADVHTGKTALYGPCVQQRAFQRFPALSHCSPNVDGPGNKQQVSESKQLQEGKKYGKACIGIVGRPLLLRLPQHIGHIQIVGKSHAGKGVEQPLIPDKEVGEQQKQQGWEQIAFMHFYTEQIHGGHQQHRAGKHCVLPL